MSKMTAFTQAQKNIRKTWFLMTSFFILFIFLGWILSYIYQSPNILYGAVIFSVLSNWFSYFFSDKVALKISGAKQADPKNPEHLRAIRAIENMSMVARIPKPQIYIIEDSAMNAFATGRDPKNASVAMTTGLLTHLDKLELEGVAAHEIAHIKNRDILIMTLVVTLVGTISIITDMAMRLLFFKDKRSDQNPILLVVGVVLIIISPIIAKLIQLAISRKREFLADASGAEITRHPAGLANALKKISSQGIPIKRVSTATAHLYIASPFGAKEKAKKSFLKNAFSTHPPVEERISALTKM